MRGESRLSTINPTQSPRRGLLGRYLDRRNRYITERRLPKFSERPIDRSTNLIHTLLYRLAFAHIGKLAVIAAYFIPTQLTAGSYK